MRHITHLSALGIYPQSKILVVVAHPDDETAFMGGFMARARKIGVEVKVVCVTDGGKSTLRFGLKNSDDLVDIRARELIHALHILGITDIIQTNFPDGECCNYKEAIMDKVLDISNSFKPDYIMSLEPDGVYGHPDHIQISQIARNICTNAQLIYATVDNHFLPDEGSRKMAEKPISPLTPNTYITLSFLESIKKIRAFKAHSSQFSMNLNFLFTWYSYRLLQKEFFYIEI